MSQIKNQAAPIKKAYSKLRTKFKRLSKRSALLRYRSQDLPEGVEERYIFLFAYDDKTGFMLFNDEATVIWHPNLSRDVDPATLKDVQAYALILADDFHKVMKAASKGELTVIFTEEDVTIKRGTRDYKISAATGADLLLEAFKNKVQSYEADEKPIQPFEAQRGLANALKKAHVFASDDKSRPNLCHVNLRLEDQKARVVATNGHYLYYFKGDLSGPQGEFVEMFVSPTVLECVEKVGEHDVLKIWGAQIPRLFRAEGLNLQVAGVSELRLRTGNYLFFSHVDASTFAAYPDIERITPDYPSRGGTTSALSVKIDPRVLTQILKEAKPFTNAYDNIQITQDVSEGVLKVTARGETLEFSAPCDMLDHNDWKPSLTLNLNVNYMITCLNLFSDSVIMESRDSLQPVLLQSYRNAAADTCSEFCLVMPMRG